jgi:transcriptional regulator with XRE-family HTH domain
MREVGGRLIDIRGRQSQASFAPAIGVHKNTLGAYERGDTAVGGEALCRLHEAGWNINWLLCGTGPRKVADTADAATLDAESLGIAIEMADEALRGSWLPRRRYAALVALLYEGVYQRMPYAQLLDFARLTASDMARERETTDAATIPAAAEGYRQAG